MDNTKQFTEGQLRAAVMLALKIHEDSYVPPPEASEYASGKYKISMEESCYKACELSNVPRTVAPLLWLAMEWSNDLQAWANGDYDKEGFSGSHEPKGKIKTFDAVEEGLAEFGNRWEDGSADEDDGEALWLANQTIAYMSRPAMYDVVLDGHGLVAETYPEVEVLLEAKEVDGVLTEVQAGKIPDDETLWAAFGPVSTSVPVAMPLIDVLTPTVDMPNFSEVLDIEGPSDALKILFYKSEVSTATRLRAEGHGLRPTGEGWAKEGRDVVVWFSGDSYWFKGEGVCLKQTYEFLDIEAALIRACLWYEKEWVPTVGEIIYIYTALHIDRGQDDVQGGRATVTKSDGFYVCVKENPGTQYGWAPLRAKQPALRAEFGSAMAYQDPDFG